MADFEKVYSIKFETAQASNNLKLLAQRLDKVAASFQKVKRSLGALEKRLTKDVKLLGKTVNIELGQRAPRAIKKASRATENFAAKMKKADDRIRDLQYQAVVGSRHINKLGNDGQKAGNKITLAFARVAKQIKKINLQRMGRRMKDVGRSATLYLTTPIIGAGAAMVKFSSDYQEAVNKVDVSFKGNSNEVKAFAKTTLKQFGIAEGSALDMAALFGDMGTSMGLTTKEASKMSRSMVGLAGDLSSLKNIDIEQAQTALAGIFTGETESLKRIGYVPTIKNLQAFGEKSGNLKGDEKFKDLDQAEQVVLRYKFIMDAASNAQGDFARTGEDAANQTRKFKEGTKQLAQSFGKHILPLYTKAITKLNELVEAFGAMTPAAKKVVLAIGGIVAAIGPLLLIGGAFAAANPIVLAIMGIIAALALLAVAYPYMVKTAEDAIGFVVKAWETGVQNIELAINSMLEFYFKTLRAMEKGRNWIRSKLGLDPIFDMGDLNADLDEVHRVRNSILGPQETAGDKYQIPDIRQSGGANSEFAMQTATQGAAFSGGGSSVTNNGGATTVNVNGSGNPDAVGRAVVKAIKKEKRKDARQMSQAANNLVPSQ